MNSFEWALPLIRKGLRVRRAVWGTGFIEMSCNGIIMLDPPNHNAQAWAPTQEDVLADDWQIAI
jgi:hypothetical protein